MAIAPALGLPPPAAKDSQEGFPHSSSANIARTAMDCIPADDSPRDLLTDL